MRRKRILISEPIFVKHFLFIEENKFVHADIEFSAKHMLERLHGVSGKQWTVGNVVKNFTARCRLTVLHALQIVYGR